MENGINLIGEIDFKDVKVKVYNDPYTEDDVVAFILSHLKSGNTCC